MERGHASAADLEAEIALMRSCIQLAGAGLGSAATQRARQELIRRITFFAERLQELLARRASALPN